MTESTPPLRSEVADADFFKKVGYTTVWEDERIIEDGLLPETGQTALSITSGGDFSLQLLLHDVTVHSIDFNPRQSFLLEFKRAAALVLDHDELWEVLGLVASERRAALYQRLRRELPADAQQYWDAQHKAVAGGILKFGKQDHYLHRIGQAITWLQGKRRIRHYFECDDPDDQRRFFDRTWNGPLWRLVGSTLFSRAVLNRFFHKDHFRYAQRDQHPGAVIRAQVDRTFRDIPGPTNFYLHWAVYQTYPDRERCPAWLRESVFDNLRGQLNRLHIHTGELEQFVFGLPDNSIDCFNFSNIFDWVSEEAFATLMREIVRVARPGARLCYWTNVVNTRRELASAGIAQLVEDVDLGHRIHAAARTPGYSSCTIGRVEK